MRQYECICTKCRTITQKSFNEPYPEYGDVFEAFCHICNDSTSHTRTLTKRTKFEINKRKKRYF